MGMVLSMGRFMRWYAYEYGLGNLVQYFPKAIKKTERSLVLRIEKHFSKATFNHKYLNFSSRNL